MLSLLAMSIPQILPRYDAPWLIMRLVPLGEWFFFSQLSIFGNDGIHRRPVQLPTKKLAKTPNKYLGCHIPPR